MDIIENLTTEIKYECDVLVCGGGFGGIAAALAASRENKKVILMEKQYMLGGLATAGLITIYLPLCDGYGKQVSFGIAEELLRLSVSLGDEDGTGKNWWQDENGSRTENDCRYMSRYNPQIFAVLAEKALLNEGVQILYGTYAVKCHTLGDKIEAVMAENKSGRFAVKAKSFIDATGDGDIAHLANAPCDTFKQGNILAAWYYGYSKASGYKLVQVGASDVPDDHKNEQNAVKTLIPERFTGVEGEEISRFVQLSHEYMLNHVLEQRKELGEDLVPVTMPTVPQLRMTRKLKGEYVLHDSMMHTYFDDSIGMVSDWRKRGPVYEVPFRTLYTSKIKNLVMAGRCTSVTEAMWDIMRVIPCCAVTGQAAGIAASMTDDITSLNVDALQEKLRLRGVVIHEKDLK